MGLLTANDFKNADLMVDSHAPLDLTNLSKIRENRDVFYTVALDDKPIKTIYKDALYLPSRALAVAIAEEWEQQLETIDMRTMHLNSMMSKAVKARLDPSLNAYMKKEILKVISNDQICFVEGESQNEYKAKLRQV